MKISFALAMLAIILLKDGHSYCGNKSNQDCSQLDYREYKMCKRSETSSSSCRNSCEEDSECSSCNECNCEECYECSSSSCNSCCNSCCNTVGTCYISCKRSCSNFSCRKSCKDQCRKEVPKENSDRVFIPSSHSNNSQSLNTEIHLNNIISTHNEISVPVNISEPQVIPPSNTWVIPQPNVPVQPKTWIFPPGNVIPYPVTWPTPQPTEKTPICCDIFFPECVGSGDTKECSYKNRRVCGPQCQSPILHQYCKSPPCEKNTVLIPQPKPTCSWVNYWPYSNCGPPQQPNCAGCYGHYFGQQRIRCSTFCYDEGYGFGPYYRKGPFFRPCYMHTPPCFAGGMCENFSGYQQNFCGYGFGEQLPGFGWPVPSFVGTNSVGGYDYNYLAGFDIIEEPFNPPENATITDDQSRVNKNTSTQLKNRFSNEIN